MSRPESDSRRRRGNIQPTTSFGGLLETRQVLISELGEEGGDLAEALPAQAIDALRAVTAFVHQARLLQHLEVLGYCRTADCEPSRNGAGGEFSLVQQTKDLPPSRFGDRPEYIVHQVSVSIHLRKCQLTNIPRLLWLFCSYTRGEMSTHARALVIGLLGPSLAALGLLWLAVEALVDPRTGKFGFHHLMFNGPHLLVAAGTALSLMAIPLALRVAAARPEEVEIPVFDRDLAPEAEERRPQPAPR